MSDKLGLGPMTFGFDIGIASVGWAVLNDTRIVDLGVRAFDAAEEPKTGASLNEHRRTVATQRNRLRGRCQRLKKLRRLLRDAGALPTADIQCIEAKPPAAPDTWMLRADGLDRLLSPQEWARVLYHIVKHRGFYAARKSETTDEEKEGGKLSKGVRRTTELMQGRWRTVGEMAARDAAFGSHKRNKAGSYANSFSRKLLAAELAQLFSRQRELGNTCADAALESEVTGLLWLQKPPITGKAMLEMVGKCTFERSEYRAPKRSFSAERFIWLSKLNNIKVVDAGDRRTLTEQERQQAKDLPYKLSKVTWKQLRRAIGMADSPSVGFAGLSYGSKRNKKGEAVDPEDATLVELKGWHQMRKELEAEPTRSTWERISSAALSGNPADMDAIALSLSIFKSDDELRPELQKLGLNETDIEAILRIDYTDFLQLSTLAISRLMPALEAGLRYDQACERAGYSHANPTAASALSRLLPPIRRKEVRNPVVFRSLNQARKVLNALIREYGSPCAVHVELARDLSKPFDERKDIERGQKEFQEEKQRAVDYFVDQIGRLPKADELLKLRLYREQDGQCAYSLKPLAPEGDIRRIFEVGVTQIDHVLPYSRSFDDSLNNKALVLTTENQNKGNRTPFEYLDGANDSQRWREFEAWVRGHKLFRKAKRDRLLRQNFGPEEAQGFRERNLNDTRYVTRLFAGMVRQQLAFAPDETGTLRPLETRVLCPAGGFTSFLRARWGLVKDRGASDLHHALDACVIAAASPALQKRVSDFSRRNELVQLRDGSFADQESGEILSAEAATELGMRFPQPWPFFREEVIARLSSNPAENIAGHYQSYSAETLSALRPVLVSRAVKRRSGGAVHQDTVRSVKKHLGPSTSSRRVPLERLKLSDLPDIVGADDPRNAGLMTVLRNRLEAHKGDGKKAFGMNTEPVRKPRRDGTEGPLIRAVKLKDVQKGGVPVRGGVADQASIWRVDVFAKTGKHYLVPVYQSDRRRGAELPRHAATANTERKDWTAIDESFQFVFSLYPNDLIGLKTKKAEFFGYFDGMDVNTAAITILSPAAEKILGKDGRWRSLGVKVGVEKFEKFHVDVLGRYYPAKAELRHGLA